MSWKVKVGRRKRNGQPKGCRCRLENVLQGELDNAWVRGQALNHAKRGRRILVGHRIRELRVVEHVGRRRAELDSETLGDREALQSGNVNVVNRIELESSAAYVRQSAVARLNVLGVRVVGQVANHTCRVVVRIGKIGRASCRERVSPYV